MSLIHPGSTDIRGGLLLAAAGLLLASGLPLQVFSDARTPLTVGVGVAPTAVLVALTWAELRRRSPIAPGLVVFSAISVYG